MAGSVAQCSLSRQDFRISRALPREGLRSLLGNRFQRLGQSVEPDESNHAHDVDAARGSIDWKNKTIVTSVTKSQNCFSRFSITPSSVRVMRERRTAIS